MVRMFLITLLLVCQVEAQTLIRVVPEAAAPGDLIRLDGSGFLAGSQILFVANIGGVQGTLTLAVNPVSEGSMTFEAIVPVFPEFANSMAANPGSHLGSVTVMNNMNPTTSVAFSFIQAIPTVSTIGLGSPQVNGIGRASSSYTAAGGPPISGNPSFVMSLENATPMTFAYLAYGTPQFSSQLFVNGGTVTIDLAQPFFFHPAVFQVDESGRAFCPFAIPPQVFNIAVCIQWIVVQNGAPIALSNGLAGII